MIAFLLVVLICYVLGSMPSAYIAGKMTKNIDIREYGSGNVGATNVARVIGKVPGILVLVIDMLKGFVAVYFISRIYLNETWMVDSDITKSASAVSVIAGHIWSVFLGFKGGKGVATSIGAFLALSTYPVLCSVILFITVFSMANLVSVGSIIAGFSLPVFFIIWKEPVSYIIAGIFSAIVIIVKHIPNIKRILEGKELGVRSCRKL